MPEGPSIVILKELVSAFTGKKILEASGNTKIDKSLIKGRKILAFKSWGKHFLICLPDRTVRIHFMLFGSYSINEQTKPKPRLQLDFVNGTIYFYSCSVQLIEEKLDDVYDWSADTMNEHWNAVRARKKLKALPPDTLVCDALLDQHIFAGVGNIIKNEVLFRIGVHPGSELGKLPPRKLGALIKEAREYSFDFLRWKKAFELKKHWQVYARKLCPDGKEVVVKVPHMGKTKRRTFFCEGKQRLYV